MKRWMSLILLCALLSACGPMLRGEPVASPIDAAMKTVERISAGAEKVRLHADDIDEEELFRAVEALWPYAATMQITVFEGGIYEVSLDVADRARQDQAAVLAKGMAMQAVQGLTEDADKLRALHDLLIRSCVYDLETAQTEGELDGASAPFTAYGALVNGRAVCAGYARAYVLLCRAAGLDAIYIADMDMNHGWNAVRLAGKDYFIDCTFDDPVPDRGDEVSDAYFMLDADALAKTHTWDRAFYARVMDAKWAN